MKRTEADYYYRGYRIVRLFANNGWAIEHSGHCIVSHLPTSRACEETIEMLTATEGVSK